MATRARGICRLCRKEVALSDAGRLRGHVCPGTYGTGYHQGGGLPATVTKQASAASVKTTAEPLTKEFLQKLEVAVMAEIPKHDAMLVKPSVAWHAFFEVLWEKYSELSSGATP